MQIKVADSQRQDLDAVVAAPIVQDVLQNVGIAAFRRAREKACRRRPRHSGAHLRARQVFALRFQERTRRAAGAVHFW